MGKVYCAHFWLNGEDRIVKAESLESLRLAIFGRAYAPAPESVMYWQEGKDNAREIIQKRLGRDLGPIKTMPKDTRKAVYMLALQLQRESTL